MAGIGAPGEDVKGRSDAGTAVLTGETYGRDLVSYEIRPARGTAENGDRFGSAVALSAGPDPEFLSDARLVVGAPGEDVGARADAGAARIVPLYRSCEHGCGSNAYPGDDEAVTLVQGRRHTPGSAGAGNQFGAAVSWLPGVDGGTLVAAPGQTVGGQADAGAVAVLDPDPANAHQVDQDTGALPGGAHSDARFGKLPNR